MELGPVRISLGWTVHRGLVRTVGMEFGMIFIRLKLGTVGLVTVEFGTVEWIFVSLFFLQF